MPTPIPPLVRRRERWLKLIIGLMVLLALMGLGPLGAAFFLWDRALKGGDARHIGILSYLTPLASTALLMVVSGRAFSWSIGLAAVMIIGAAVLGSRVAAPRRDAAQIAHLLP